MKNVKINILLVAGLAIVSWQSAQAMALADQVWNSKLNPIEAMRAWNRVSGGTSSISNEGYKLLNTATEAIVTGTKTIQQSFEDIKNINLADPQSPAYPLALASVEILIAALYAKEVTKQAGQSALESAYKALDSTISSFYETYFPENQKSDVRKAFKTLWETKEPYNIITLITKCCEGLDVANGAMPETKFNPKKFKEDLTTFILHAPVWSSVLNFEDVKDNKEREMLEEYGFNMVKKLAPIIDIIKNGNKNEEIKEGDITKINNILINFLVEYRNLYNYRIGYTSIAAEGLSDSIVDLSDTGTNNQEHKNINDYNRAEILKNLQALGGKYFQLIITNAMKVTTTSSEESAIPTIHNSKRDSNLSDYQFTVDYKIIQRFPGHRGIAVIPISQAPRTSEAPAKSAQYSNDLNMQQKNEPITQTPLQKALDEVADFFGYKMENIPEGEKTESMKAVDEIIKKLWKSETEESKKELKKVTLVWTQSKNPEELLLNVGSNIRNAFQEQKSADSRRKEIWALFYSRNVWYAIINSFKGRSNETELDAYTSNIFKILDQTIMEQKTGDTDAFEKHLLYFLTQLESLFHHLQTDTKLINNATLNDVITAYNQFSAAHSWKLKKYALQRVVLGIAGIIGITALYYYRNAIFTSASSYLSPLLNAAYERMPSLPFANHVPHMNAWHRYHLQLYTSLVNRHV